MFLQKWRAKVEVRFLRRCVDPNAPKEPLDADAQAEAESQSQCECQWSSVAPLSSDSSKAYYYYVVVVQ